MNSNQLPSAISKTACLNSLPIELKTKIVIYYIFNSEQENLLNLTLLNHEFRNIFYNKNVQKILIEYYSLKIDKINKSLFARTFKFPSKIKELIQNKNKAIENMRKLAKENK